jgi:hypothetical protein
MGKPIVAVGGLIQVDFRNGNEQKLTYRSA